MKDINFKIHGELKNTDFIMENTFWIGLYPGLTQEHLAYTISKIDKFFKI
jgi:CDP-6-deoxy-D-xylo-4-hexulose-3-dehydrase